MTGPEHYEQAEALLRRAARKIRKVPGQGRIRDCGLFPGPRNVSR
jgi:hypothetical protein